MRGCSVVSRGSENVSDLSDPALIFRHFRPSRRRSPLITLTLTAPFTLALGASLIALMACTAPPASSTAESTDGPKWKTPPRAAYRDYPNAALEQKLSGIAAARCMVTPNGKPANCIVERETPTGYGFGTSAISIVMRARFDPRTIRPEDVGTTFVVTVPYNLH